MAIQKDYKAIASIIRQEYAQSDNMDNAEGQQIVANQAITNVALNIANYFESANPWFNKAQFLVACEFEE